jgi:F-type H+-transporting ATPase subunit epsilon
MSSSASASAYWRVAGMTYLKYANLCADMVRSALKEPLRTKAKVRETVFFRSANWKDGKPQTQGKALRNTRGALGATNLLLVSIFAT